MDLLIKDGRIIDPSQGIDEVGSILISDGKIEKIDNSIPEDGCHVIDASGLIVCPGFIDMHTHFREPGREDKETLFTCSRAAARGGFTTVVGMPNTNPACDNQTVVEYVKSRAKEVAIVNMEVVGCISKKREGKELAEIGELKRTGAIAVSDDGGTIQNADVMRKAFEYCNLWHMPIISHSEDYDLSGDGCMNEGYVSTMLGLPGIPSLSENVIIGRELLLAEFTNSPIHFTHISNKVAVAMIRDAKRRGVKATCDTMPHYFSLTEEACIDYNPMAKVNPPLRTAEDVEAIKKGLEDGTVDAIATDHAPHLRVEKFYEFADCENGISGLETAVPLAITNLIHTDALPLTEFVAKFTINPAKILHLDRGTLSLGKNADITILDLEKEEVVDPEQFESKGKNTPFAGMNLKGMPVYTIVNGKIVMKDRKIIE